MRYTNLDLVQAILSALDGDEVNSVSDTAESLQVLRCVRTAYLDIAAIGELTRDNDLFQLIASGDTAKPVTMTLPSDVARLEWLKYDAQTADDPVVDYQPVYPMELRDFIEMSTGMDVSADNVISYTHAIGSNTFTLYCNNDRAPRYYTTTDDNTILFDSYDADVDDTLKNNKTMAFGQKTFAWSDTDIFVPFLDEKQAQRLLHEAKALAFAELKQSQHLKAEKMARDIKIDQQASKHKINIQTDYDLIPNFGRNAPRGRVKPTGRYK